MMSQQVVPSRQVHATAAGGGVKKTKRGAPSGSVAAAEPADPSDLLPRTDIAPQITDELVRRLHSANWKVRRSRTWELPRRGIHGLETWLAAAEPQITTAISACQACCDMSACLSRCRRL